MNNKYFDVCWYYFFGETTIYLTILIYLAKTLWSLWINKYENPHYWKSKKINSEKTVSQFSIKP